MNTSDRYAWTRRFREENDIVDDDKLDLISEERLVQLWQEFKTKNDLPDWNIAEDCYEVLIFCVP